LKRINNTLKAISDCNSDAIGINKKGAVLREPRLFYMRKGSASTTFSLPNLTINLTYLCHGMLQKYIIYLGILLYISLFFCNRTNNLTKTYFYLKYQLIF